MLMLEKLDLKRADAESTIGCENGNGRFETYCKNCHKYYSAPIRKIRNVLDENESDGDFILMVRYCI